MPRFKFRLATLLRLRDSARDECRAELAQAYQAEEILHRRQEELDGELAELARQGRSAAGPGEVDVDRLVDARRYELVLRSEQQLTGRQQEALDEEIERRRQALVEANREVRVLEILRDKQQERHRREATRQEIKELDEAAARRAPKEDVR